MPPYSTEFEAFTVIVLFSTTKFIVQVLWYVKNKNKKFTVKFNHLKCHSSKCRIGGRLVFIVEKRLTVSLEVLPEVHQIRFQQMMTGVCDVFCS